MDATIPGPVFGFLKMLPTFLLRFRFGVLWSQGVVHAYILHLSTFSLRNESRKETTAPKFPPVPEHLSFSAKAQTGAMCMAMKVKYTGHRF